MLQRLARRGRCNAQPRAGSVQRFAKQPGGVPSMAISLADRAHHGAFARADVIPPMNEADAFVLTYAFVGVLRASILAGPSSPPPAAIEESLKRLVSRFLGRENIDDPA